MIVYRFAHRKYARDLSGEGARLFGGRWNPVGQPAIYASEHISLGLLEVLVNAGSLEQLQQLRLMEIEIPDQAPTEVLTLKQLRKDWVNDLAYSQWLGAEILKTASALVLKCPSAVVHQEHNFVLNPLHKDFKKLKLRESTAFRFDERLFKHS